VTARAALAPGAPRLASVLRAREAGTAALVLVVFGAATLRDHNFADVNSIQQLLVGASLIALLGVGETLVIVTRNYDLSVGSVLGLCAFVVGDLFRHQHIPVWSGFVIAIALGAAIGAINGLITTVARVPSLVVTLAMQLVGSGLRTMLNTSG
jgi:rhamnose transport system permease protein